MVSQNTTVKSTSTEQVFTTTGPPNVIPKREAIALTIAGFTSQLLLTSTIMYITHAA